MNNWNYTPILEKLCHRTGCLLKIAKDGPFAVQFFLLAQRFFNIENAD